jgi:transcriptional regulator GlxA family with amidase domain
MVVGAGARVAGTSPITYLRQMRVRQMARLLTSTVLSIAETARAVGWTNQSYASRTFHAYYGVSPTEYRHRQTPTTLEH